MNPTIQTTLAASAFAIAASLVMGCSAPNAANSAAHSTAHSTGPTSLGTHTIVVNDYEAARAAAAADGRLLLVNSTSHNASNARVMEAMTFKDPLVSEALNQFVEARLFSGANDPAIRESNQRVIDAVVQERSVPQYVALHPITGEELGRYAGLAPGAADFAQFLNDAAAVSR